MASNCREIADIVEVGVAALQVCARTRAMAEANSETAAKKRRVNNTFSQLNFSSSSRPYVQFSDQQDSVAPATEEKRLPSYMSSRDAPASCCSSNGRSELGKEDVEFMDLEEEADGEVETATCYCSRERRETMPSSEVREKSEVVVSTRSTSTEKVESSRGLTAEKMPTESELQEFFACHETEIQKRFAEKYNYDIGKDKPVEEGRYEWVRLKP